MALDEDGQDLLQVTPDRVHAKRPCFLGSPLEMTELRDDYLQSRQ
jgi:fructose-1,6-bisphosphatase